MNPLRRSGPRVSALILVLSVLAGLVPASADDGGPAKIWITLKDKGPSALPPSASGGGSPALRAYEDLPVYAPYIESLGARGFRPDIRLKWQNRVSGYADAASLAGLRALPFVASVSGMPRKAKSRLPPQVTAPWRPPFLSKKAADGLDYGRAASLMGFLHVDQLHGYLADGGAAPGKGMRVAVIDADFHLGSPIFAAMKARIKDQYDFVDKRPIAVTDSLKESHGAECMSLIGGNLPGTLVGIAPDAEFLLYRAEEDAQERYVEEDYVAAAIERAVDSGAQVISISLGYRYDYTDGSPELAFAQFDGRTRPSSLAAVLAARRDVLISASMGNEGGRDPSGGATIDAPADADSILAVGIADSTGRRCGYSSTGPSADGRVKPDLVSVGLGLGCTVAVADPAEKTVATENLAGTSFAAPVLAGIAAILRQARPSLSAETIRQALLSSAGRHAAPDSQVGYGMVDVAAAAGKIGIPLLPPLVLAGIAPLYHAGEENPIVLGWRNGAASPALRVIDLSGRHIPVTVRASGSLLYVTPEHPLGTGIYIAHIP